MPNIKSIAKFVGIAALTFVVGAIAYRLVKPVIAKVLPASVIAYLP